jgi:hypothetical protein
MALKQRQNILDHIQSISSYEGKPIPNISNPLIIIYRIPKLLWWLSVEIKSYKWQGKPYILNSITR